MARSIPEREHMNTSTAPLWSSYLDLFFCTLKEFKIFRSSWLSNTAAALLIKFEFKLIYACNSFSLFDCLVLIMLECFSFLVFLTYCILDSFVERILSKGRVSLISNALF